MVPFIDKPMLSIKTFLERNIQYITYISQNYRVFRLDFARGCETPHLVYMRGFNQPDRPIHLKKIASANYSFDSAYECFFEREFARSLNFSEFGCIVVLAVPCRKCEHCLYRRSRTWQFRIKNEAVHSMRNWLGTLTLSPYEHFKVKCQIGDYPSELSELKARHEVISKEITLFIKRVRKNSKANFRYFLAMECHRSGLPHYHIIFHDLYGDLRKRVLEKAWQLGFSNFKLVDVEATTYVAKYISKSLFARVRASQGYGRNSPF